ncbi:DEGP protease 5 isoform X2 [Wolffia australiana]
MFFAVSPSSSSPARPPTDAEFSSSSSSSSSSSLPSICEFKSRIRAGIPHNSRRRLLLASSASFLLNPSLFPSILPAKAEEIDDELQQDEDRTVRIFRETSPSVVFIKDFRIAADKNKARPVNNPNSLAAETGEEDEDDADVQVLGVGSGFVWDSSGHVVTNYHVIEKLAMDQSGLLRCKDPSGKTFSREGKLIGLDPAHDLAVLKVDVSGEKLRPVNVGSSRDLRVGQSCYAIGNPYGYDHTLTTGIVSGLGREIPSPNGGPIRGAIQTDAAINSGNSGGPLIDSHGRVIGVNTATFTRRGTGMSSGVNFAIPIDLVVQTVPYLIVNGTATSNRF